MTANSNATTDVAEAGAGASGVVTGTAQGQSTGGAFTEAGHKAATDVNTEELISTLNGALTALANGRVANEQALEDLKYGFKVSMDTVAILGAQSAQTTQDMVAKQAVRHSDLAIDRQWNLNETDIAASATLARLIERLNNPTPPAN